jgi:hypothetical protein
MEMNFMLKILTRGKTIDERYIYPTKHMVQQRYFLDKYNSKNINMMKALSQDIQETFTIESLKTVEKLVDEELDATKCTAPTEKVSKANTSSLIDKKLFYICHFIRIYKMIRVV